ncbi:MAG: helix-turn-helix domain-containing protein [Planctomycetota bacterium]|nr:helix-turn-helix domain-containing protein [Planctomycetota bacterium]MDI6787309.1 helix-turn-helix domain-containing protein [Planctomycetota bacterium]
MMTIKDVCKFLSISRDTVYRLIQSGKLTATRIGGQWRFTEKEIDRFLASQTLSKDVIKPDLMTFNEVCKYLGLSRVTVYKLINTNQLPAMKPCGRWRFPKDAVKQFLTSGRDVPTHVWGANFEGGVMGLSEASKYLGVHRDTVYRLIKEGKLPASKIGGVWRLIKSEVSRYIIRRKYSYGMLGVSGACFFWSNVLDKYYKEPTVYYVKDSAYDGFVGSRRDYCDYKFLSAWHSVMEQDRFFAEVHYRKVQVKGGVILMLTNKQYRGLPAKELTHWSQYRLSESQLSRMR